SDTVERRPVLPGCRCIVVDELHGGRRHRRNRAGSAAGSEASVSVEVDQRSGRKCRTSIVRTNCCGSIAHHTNRARRRLHIGEDRTASITGTEEASVERLIAINVCTELDRVERLTAIPTPGSIPLPTTQEVAKNATLVLVERQVVDPVEAEGVRI